MSSSLTDVVETVANCEQMLDAGYLMLDGEESTIGEFHHYPVSRNQNPGSVNTGAGFYCSSKN